MAHGNVKCDCGHVSKTHFAGEGCCNKCGCTWFYPNVKYINLQKKKKKLGRIFPRSDKPLKG